MISPARIGATFSLPKAIEAGILHSDFSKTIFRIGFGKP
jgi:hypothetical protein